MRHPQRTLLISVIGLSVISWWTGCTVGPDYEAPVPEMPDSWHQQLAEGLIANDTAPPSKWWTLLNDPILNELVQKARDHNTDLRSAYWNLTESRYARNFHTGRYYPSLDGMGSYRRSLLSENSYQGQFSPDPFSMYSLGFDSFWESNLFGRVSRTVESAQASYEAQIENFRDVLVSLTAEVARNYVELRTVQARLQYALKNSELQEGVLNLAKARFKSEMVPRLDVEQARLNLADTRSRIPLLRSAEKAAVNRLGVLTGTHPGKLAAQLSDQKSIPVPPEKVQIHMPAELLRQRPDIRRAERQLAAQTARIGIATAELYPHFSLSGAIGLEAMDFSNLFRHSSRNYSFGPSFQWSIFKGNSIRNQINIEESRTEALYWHYRSTVLRALEEVENAITDYVQEKERQQVLLISVEAAKESVALVTTQYENGLTDFQSVLVLQRSQFQQEDKLAESRGLAVQHLIRIYKALGGWYSDVLPDFSSEKHKHSRNNTEHVSGESE